ncbi:MAG: hypothetical protein OEX22_07055 [Cyclobacteriaceae bacterium]|nr:hypothetical protein [Cyclobacteriaceae bacterium]
MLIFRIEAREVDELPVANEKTSLYQQNGYNGFRQFDSKTMHLLKNHIL